MAADKDSDNKNNYVNTTVHKGWLIAAGVAIVVILILMAASVGRRFSVNHNEVAFGRRGGFSLVQKAPLRFGGESGTAQNRLTGVVTAVNGSSFTIAGDGATNTVTTNSSTQWQGASSVKTNDSVVVLGNLSNNTFTATEVAVNP